MSGGATRLRPRRLLATAGVATLLAITGLGTGCDTDDSGGERAAAAPDVAAARDQLARVRVPRDNGDPTGLGPKGQMQEAISDIQSDFTNGIGATCFELSAAGERELARHVRPPDCTTVASALSRMLRQMSVPLWYSRVVSVDIDGSRAVATLETIGAGRHRARFFKEGAKGWRLGSLRDAEPVAWAVPDPRDRAVERAAEDVYAKLATGDAKAVCERLTPSAEVTVGQGSGGCRGAMEELVDLAERGRGAKALGQVELGPVRFYDRGIHAIVTVGSSGSTLRLRFLEGRWLLVEAPPLPFAGNTEG